MDLGDNVPADRGYMVTLIQGDCLEVMKDIPDKSVDAVITDPPYKLSSGGHDYPEGMCHHFDKLWGYSNDGKLFDVPNFEDWIPIIFDISKPSSEFFMMVNDKNIQGALNIATQNKYRLHNVIVWDKQIKIANKWFMKQCEFILYFWKGLAKNINNMGTSQLFSMNPGNIGSKVHPSEKPINLMKMIIENATSEGDTILDPFMGSGTTGVACVQTGRNFIGIEIDPTYFAIAEKRIHEAEQQPCLV